MSKKPVVIYGANGYTGRLVAEALRNYRIPFIAAGRSKTRVQEAMALVPGIEAADYEVVEVTHEVDSLIELFKGAKIVINNVGPFEYYGPVVVEACAKANVHYLDSTGELSFVMKMAKEFGDQFEANGKVLAPSTAYMYTPLEIAARIVLETPGIDSLEALCSPTGTPTFGSTQTIFSIFETADTAFYLENKQRAIWPETKCYEVVVPDRAMTLLGHNWGGGTLPLYFEKDPRVVNCRQLTAFSNRTVMEHVAGMHQMYVKDIRPLPDAERKAKLKAIGESMQPGMPPRENPLINRNIDVVYGRGGNRTATCILRSFNAYQMTGILEAAVANFLINGRQLSAGFTSACEAVGYRELLGQIQNFGLIEVETR